MTKKEYKTVSTNANVDSTVSPTALNEVNVIDTNLATNNTRQ